jgi:hypothetical protein
MYLYDKDGNRIAGMKGRKSLENLQTLLKKVKVFSNLDLNGANLNIGAHLSVNIGNINLKNHYFNDSKISFINFNGTNLSGCNFNNAELLRCDFTNSILNGVSFYKADIEHTSTLIIYTINDYNIHCWPRDGDIWVRAGCHNFPIYKARKYWAGKDYRKEALAFLDYVEIAAKERGWFNG